MTNNQFFSKYYHLGNDFIKSTDQENGRIYVEGIISTENEDAQGEIMLQKGMDYSYFKKRGYLNLEHRQGPENMIGAPTELKSMKYKGIPATFMKGYLFADNPKVKEIMTSINAMKNADCDRGLGFSVEGAVIERDPKNPKIITKSKILNVSLVASPANPDSVMALCKSIYAEYMKEEEEKTMPMTEEDVKEVAIEALSKDEVDADGEMTIQNLMILKQYTEELLMMIQPESELPEWVQQHITLASDYVHSAAHYLQNQKQMMSMQQKLNEMNEIAAAYYYGKKEEDKAEKNEVENKLEAINPQSIDPDLSCNTYCEKDEDAMSDEMMTDDEAKQINCSNYQNVSQ